MSLIKLFNQRTIYSNIFFVLILILVYISKPEIMFDENNKLKSFGVGKDKTIISFGVIIVITAIFSFYLFAIIDVIFAKK